jgi:hypothetical protein
VVQAIENHSKTIQLLKKEITPEGFQEYLASRPPAKGYCSVPLELARQSQCRLAYQRHPELESPVKPDDSPDKIQSLARIIEDLSKEVPQKALIYSHATDVARASRKQMAELQARQLNGVQEITKERQKLESLKELAKNARVTWENARMLEKEITVTTTEIDESLKRQEQIRKQHKKTMSHFSETYENLVRAVLGNSLSASAGFSGKSISLSVEYNGPLTSAAIETVKIIAFDIAAMLCSVEGAGFHPRFLIHDGPREADMSAEIYQKFFLFVREMERAFEGSRMPNFQYIITTTEPPPEHLCTKPWLIDTLDASDASKRLFKANL